MRVGTSFDFASCSDFSEDHPHACGDKKDIVNESIQDEGSSPCVWGQALQFYDRHGKVRIIPMRVGTSSAFRSRDCRYRDHPHACGDKACLGEFR